MIESKIIYGWNEAVLYSLLLRKGLLNLQSGTRHKEFFKNFVETVKTEQGMKAINEYAYSDSENPPDLSGITKDIQSREELMKFNSLPAGDLGGT